MKPLYQLKKVNFSYFLGDIKIRALKEVDLNINPADFIVLAGPSGSGKSTLLNLLGLIEPPQELGLIFLNQEVKELSEKEKNKIRKFDLGFIFQSFNLNPVLTVFENIEFFLARQHIASAERKKRVLESLSSVKMEEYANHLPSQLSGGQRQRVAIARAFAKKPRVIIADEPTASLDQTTGASIIELLHHLNEKEKVTIIIASHDPMVIGNANRLLHLKDGQMEESLC